MNLYFSPMACSLATRIALYEDKLNAAMTINPHALKEAEALDRACVASRERLIDEFDRDVALQTLMAGEPNLSHSAAAQPSNQAVLRENAVLTELTSHGRDERRERKLELGLPSVVLGRPAYRNVSFFADLSRRPAILRPPEAIRRRKTPAASRETTEFHSVSEPQTRPPQALTATLKPDWQKSLAPAPSPAMDRSAELIENASAHVNRCTLQATRTSGPARGEPRSRNWGTRSA